MNIEEVFDDVKKAVGGKNFIYLIFGFIALFIIMLIMQSKQESSDNTMTVATGITSYPDAVTNANVIIDTLQNSIDYSEDNIIDAIDDVNSAIDNNFEATNDYINKGFESQKEILETNFDSMIGGITDVQSSINNVKADTTAIKNDVKNVQKAVSNTQKTTSKTTHKKNAKTQYYSYKKKKGLNTSVSIVDALTAIGVDSSKSNRAKIAKANGISNYSGTATQNIKLLKLLKAGKLKKI